MGPVDPSAFFRDDGLIIIVIDFPVLLFGIIYFQEQHPCDLFNTLGITIDTCIVTHDIPNSFYKT